MDSVIDRGIDGIRESKKSGIVWFYGTLTIVGYLMPNPFLYI